MVFAKVNMCCSFGLLEITVERTDHRPHAWAGMQEKSLSCLKVTGQGQYQGGEGGWVMYHSTMAGEVLAVILVSPVTVPGLLCLPCHTPARHPHATSPNHRPLGSAPSGSLMTSPAHACWLAEPGALSACSPVSRGCRWPGHPSHGVTLCPSERLPSISITAEACGKNHQDTLPQPAGPDTPAAFAERTDG